MYNYKPYNQNQRYLIKNYNNNIDDISNRILNLFTLNNSKNNSNFSPKRIFSHAGEYISRNSDSNMENKKIKITIRNPFNNNYNNNIVMNRNQFYNNNNNNVRFRNLFNNNYNNNNNILFNNN